MLKRSGRWWNRRRVWYYDSAPAKKTADRPHAITVILGILSPLLAVAAVIISFQGVRTSRTAMQVGQRAYLSITDGHLTISGKAAHYRFVLHNLGNTPAEEVSVKYMYSARNTGGRYITNDEKTPDIGPKDSRTFEGSLRIDSNVLPFRVTGIAYYSDAFGEAHSIDWCWLLDGEGNLRDCTTDPTLWQVFPRWR